VKILFYNHTGIVSGAERVLMMILHGLDRERYEPVVVCPSNSRTMECAGAANLRTRGMDQLNARFTWRLDLLIKYLSSFAGVISQARSIVKEESPDVIHSNSIRAGLVMAVATIGLKVPVIWHAHDILPLHPLSTVVRLFALITSRNHILAVSEAVGVAFRGTLLRLFRDRVPITVIHNSVDLDRFQPTQSARHDVRIRLNLSEDQPVVGIVGQLTPRKGQLELIQAFAAVTREIPRATLLIVGEALFNRDEEYAQRLRDAVESLNLTDNVRFLGARDDVATLMQGCDVVVVNSHQEPFALTVLEGLASGIAVLATAVGGTPEMIRHNENGWLVQPRNNEALASALLILSRDSGLRSRLSTTARQDAIARFSVPRFISEVKALYGEVLERDKKPHRENLPLFTVKISEGLKK
jgi:L-malate glycosyltransferase